MSEREISATADVREWFEQLNDMFGAVVRSEEAVMEPLLNSYAVPLTMTSDDEHQVFLDSASISDFLIGVVDSLRQASYERTVIHRLEVRLLNLRSAIVDVNVSRISTTGDEIARFSATEIASRTDDGWRISAVIATPGP